MPHTFGMTMKQPFSVTIRSKEDFLLLKKVLEHSEYNWLISIDSEEPDAYPVTYITNKSGYISIAFPDDFQNEIGLSELLLKTKEWFNPKPFWQNAKMFITTSEQYNIVLSNVIEKNGYMMGWKGSQFPFAPYIIQKTPVLILNENGTAQFISIKQSQQKKYAKFSTLEL